MINNIKNSIFFTLLLVVTSISYANSNNLTEEQQLLLSASVQQSVENFETFRNTLDVFQVAILYSPHLNNQERSKEFVTSLSLEQRALLEAFNVLDKSMKENVENTVLPLNLRYHINTSIDREEKALLEANKILKESFEDNFHLNSEDFHMEDMPL